MSYFTIEYESEVLKGGGEFSVILPEDFDASSGKKCKVLWLLHGAFGDFLSSVLYTSIARHADNRNMAIVAPSSYLGVYTDMKYGEKGYSFVKEVISVAGDMFSVLSDRREDNYVLGISMGGHGTFKLAMEMPDKFNAVAACSSPIDMVATMQMLESGNHPGGHELYDAFGSSEEYSQTVGDVIYMAEKNKAMGIDMPRLFLCWGDKDHAKFEDVITEEKFRKMGIELLTQEGKGGHDFNLWDPMLEGILNWMLDGGGQ